VSFSIGVALSAYNLAMPTEHLHAGLVGLLHSCGLDRGSGRPDPDSLCQRRRVWQWRTVKPTRSR
jgi:hypothetical protein